MSKKMFFSITLVFVLALMLSGTAFAASGDTPNRQANRIGMITSTGSNTFTIQTIGGQLFTIRVSPTTQYQRVSGGHLSFANLNLDQWVTVAGTFGRNHVLNADAVVIMPARLNWGHWTGKRAYGTVLQVDPRSRTFTLETKNGPMKFRVDDSTVFTGNTIRRFGALHAGMHAVVGYTQRRDGSLYARGVGAY